MIKGQLIWDTKNLEECYIVFRKNVFKRKCDLLVEKSRLVKSQITAGIINCNNGGSGNFSSSEKIVSFPYNVNLK